MGCANRWSAWGLFLLSVVAVAGCNEPKHLGRPMSSWIHDLDSDVDFKRRQACEALAEMGPVAQRAIPKLVERLEDVNLGVREFAELALSKMGPAALPPLGAVLSNPDPAIRLHAAAAMLAIEPTHRQAVRELETAVTGVGNAELAAKARDVLVGMGPAAIPLLKHKLDDPYAPARLYVVNTVAALKKDARPLVPTLIDMAKKDKDPEVREAAMKAMAAAGPRAAVEGSFRELLDDPNEDISGTAGAMLVFIGARGGTTGTEGEDSEPSGTDPVKKMELLNVVNQPAADDE